MLQTSEKEFSTVALKTTGRPYRELTARSQPPLRKHSVGALAVQSLERYFWLLHLGRLELLESLNADELETLSQFLRHEVAPSELRRLWSHFDNISADLSRRLRVLSSNALLALLDAAELRWRKPDDFASLRAVLSLLIEINQNPPA